jgi:hypothetical protein
MAKNDDVQLVESIGGIDATLVVSDVKSVHVHGFVGASSTNITSNPIVVVVSNLATIASDSAKV